MHKITGLLFPLAPFVLAVFPLLSLFASNQTEAEFRVLWWPLVWCLVAAALVFAIPLALSRSASKAAVIASLIMVCFFYYELFPAAAHTWFLVLWLLLFAVAVVVAALSRRSLVAVSIVLLAAGLAMAIPPLVQIVRYHAQHPAPAATDPALWPSRLQPPQAQGTLPDIYVLMPDDHARADVLKHFFGYDNAPFLHQLEQRGFVIAPDNRSPYSYSEMNMASLLNLDYLSRFPNVVGKDSQDMRPVKRVLQDNRAARLLGGLGYQYVHIDTDEVTYAGRNPDISPVATPDSFMSLWLQQTLLREIGGPIGFADSANDQRFRETIRAGFQQLAAVRPGSSPKFVVFHTLLPHDPFIFGADGRPVTFPAGADHTGRQGVTYYLQQLQFLDQQLLTAVDSIQAHATTPPIILIQADEGFEVDPSVVGGDRNAETIRVRGLSAFSLPGLTSPGVPNPPNTVNDLRYIFNAYFGTSYPMLPSVSYPEHDDFYYRFTDELKVP